MDTFIFTNVLEDWDTGVVILKAKDKNHAKKRFVEELDKKVHGIQIHDGEQELEKAEITILKDEDCFIMQGGA
jgi:hypothetical protein